MSGVAICVGACLSFNCVGLLDGEFKALVGYDTGRGLGDFWSDLGFVMVAVVTAGSLYIGGGELVRDLFE